MHTPVQRALWCDGPNGPARTWREVPSAVPSTRHPVLLANGSKNTWKGPFVVPWPHLQSCFEAYGCAPEVRVVSAATGIGAGNSSSGSGGGASAYAPSDSEGMSAAPHGFGIEGSAGAARPPLLAYVASHLDYMLHELLKNALR